MRTFIFRQKLQKNLCHCTLLHFTHQSSVHFESRAFEDMFAVAKQYETMNSRPFFPNSQPSSRTLTRTIASGEHDHFWRIRLADIVDVIRVSQIHYRTVMIPADIAGFNEFWASEVDFLFEIQ